MNKNDDICYAIPIGDLVIIYSPLKSILALVNEKVALQIRDEITDNRYPKDCPAVLRELIKNLENQTVARKPYCRQAFDPAFLGIIPTRSYNIDCIYCDFGATKYLNDRLKLEDATVALEWMAEHLLRLNKHVLPIHFFGGEPFVAYDLIKRIVEEAKNLAEVHNLKTYFQVSTNGYFSEKRAVEIGRLFNSVVISFDGFRAFHNVYRPVNNDKGSFEVVERSAHILNQSSSELRLRCCVTDKSVGSMAKISQWFYERFKPNIINFETLKPNAASACQMISPPNPIDFAINWYTSMQCIEGHSCKIIYASAQIDEIKNTFCPVGQDTVIVFPDGNLHSCYLPPEEWKKKNLGLGIGRLDKDRHINIDYEAAINIRKMVTQKSRCQKCFCRWTCAGGCHVHNTYPGCSPDYSDFCIQTRIITLILLLKEIDMQNELNSLMCDRNKLEKIAFRTDDRILYYNGGN